MATRCVWCGVVVDSSDRRKMRKHLGEKCKKYLGREEMDALHKRVIELECIEGELKGKVTELENTISTVNGMAQCEMVSAVVLPRVMSEIRRVIQEVKI